MRKFLAMVILGGALAATASAAFADDSVNGYPRSSGTESITVPSGTQSMAVAGEAQNPTRQFRQGSLGK